MKKKESKHNPFPSFDFLQNHEKSSISFKKINQLPKPSVQARLIYYIPEKNLLLIVLRNLSTVKIYNTITFNLLAVKITQEMYCMTYCQRLGKILVGGDREVLQLWDPITFRVEAECLKRHNDHSIRSLAYLSESNVIVAKLDNQLRFYDTELRCFKNINIRFSGHGHPNNAEILGLSKSLFLTFRLDGNRKIPIMFNINTESYREFSKEVYIPIESCVEMIENSPKNVFTCLGMFNGKPARPEDEKTVYQLIQFTIDLKMDEFSPVKSSNISTHSFRKLRSVKNSKFFLAERFDKSTFQTCLLSVNKNQVEILKVISMPSQMILSQVNTYEMIKDGFSLVEVDSKHQVIVYKSLIHRDKSNDSLKDDV